MKNKEDPKKQRSNKEEAKKKNNKQRRSRSRNKEGRSRRRQKKNRGRKRRRTNEEPKRSPKKKQRRDQRRNKEDNRRSEETKTNDKSKRSKTEKQKRTWRESNPHINVLQAKGLKDNASPIGQQVLVCWEPHFSFCPLPNRQLWVPAICFQDSSGSCSWWAMKVRFSCPGLWVTPKMGSTDDFPLGHGNFWVPWHYAIYLGMYPLKHIHSMLWCENPGRRCKVAPLVIA